MYYFTKERIYLDKGKRKLPNNINNISFMLYFFVILSLHPPLSYVKYTSSSSMQSLVIQHHETKINELIKL